VSTTQPPFALCGPCGTLVGSGVQTRYCNVQAALRSGSAPILLGALPFDMGAPVALLVPNTVLRTDGPPDWPATRTPGSGLDGRWVVSIRCTQLSADRRTALAHAGGISAESDPDDEVDETTTKFATIFNALGVDQ
jgi:isochorismate synthase EntC